MLISRVLINSDYGVLDIYFGSWNSLFSDKIYGIT